MGVLALIPKTTRTGTAFATVISLTWMGVAVAPLLDGLPWNVVSAIVWLTVAAISALATLSRKA